MKQSKPKKPAVTAQRVATPGGAPAPPKVAEALIATAVMPVLTEVLVNGVITLPAHCVLRDAVTYRQRLLECGNSAAIGIDAEAVERIDTAFIQVLVAFMRGRAADAGPVTWLNISTAFAEAITILGLQSLLAVPELRVAA
jgi:phospholipid transport system transporter-binding protein